MAHISRKELKKDEVRETLAHGAQAVLSHQQFTVYLLIAAVLAALGAFGMKIAPEYGGQGLSQLYYNRALMIAGSASPV